MSWGYIIKENKALTIKKNLHSILYLNSYKVDTSQFYFVKSKRDRERESKMIVTLTSYVPKIMAGDQGNMQHRLKCLNLILKIIFQGCIF